MNSAQNHTHPTKAVIYCRVSGAKQVREGDGLASQETRCREYATYKDYDVVEVFADDMSGKFERRPAMDRMLAFLRLHKRKGSVVVIIDDISRFARDVQAHITLRQTLSEAGGILESPSIEFGEDSDSRLVEHMLASVAQHQREKNAEQTSNRMKGRLMNGYAVFSAPIGYTYKKTGHQGKLLTRVEPLASVIAEGLEAYASGRIGSPAELKRFYESEPCFPKNKRGRIHPSRVTEILNRVIYAGYIESEKWGVSRRKGHHEALISLETHQKIQERLTTKPIAPARKDINLDFPLRGFVACDCCGAPMTAAWSTSRNGVKHPYYFCHQKSCEKYRKSFRRADVDAAVEKTLKQLQPSQGLFTLLTRMMKDAWALRMDQQGCAKRELQKRRTVIDKDIDKTLDKIVTSNNATVIAAFEKRVDDLQNERCLIEDKLSQGTASKVTLEDLFEPAREFLSNPWNLYKNGTYQMKRMVLKLAFKGPITYTRETGVRTAQLTVIFRFIEELSQKIEMVPPHGLEPRTY